MISGIGSCQDAPLVHVLDIFVVLVKVALKSPDVHNYSWICLQSTHHDVSQFPANGMKDCFWSASVPLFAPGTWENIGVSFAFNQKHDFMTRTANWNCFGRLAGLNNISNQT